MLDSFPKSAELNQGRRNPPALNYIKEHLFPTFFTRVNGDFNLLLIRRGVESKVNGVAIAGAETDGVFEEICNTAHRDLNQRSLLFDVLRNKNGLELLIVNFLINFVANISLYSQISERVSSGISNHEGSNMPYGSNPIH